MNYIVVIFLLWLYLFLILPKMWIYCKFKDKISLHKRYGFFHRTMIVVSWAFRVKYEIIGLENIPQNGPVLFVGNHQSAFDPLAIGAILKIPVSFVAKKESLKMPYIGTFIKILSGVFLDRDDIRQSLGVFRQIAKELQEIPDRRFLIFPEGTRTESSQLMLNDYKPGALKPAYDAKATIIPFYMNGSYRVLKTKFRKKVKIKIVFDKAMPYEEYSQYSTTELAKKIQNNTAIRIADMNKLDPIEPWYQARMAKKVKTKKVEK